MHLTATLVSLVDPRLWADGGGLAGILAVGLWLVVTGSTRGPLFVAGGFVVLNRGPDEGNQR